MRLAPKSWATAGMWKSLRLRLAIWSTAVLAATLVSFSLVVYLTTQYALLDSMDTTLSGRAARTAHFLPVHAQAPYLAGADIQSTLDAFSAPAGYLQVVDPTGRVVARSASVGAAVLPLSAHALADAAAGRQSFYTASGLDTMLRLSATPLYAAGSRRPAGVLLVARSLSALSDTLITLRRDLLAAGAAALLAAAAVTVALARRALHPIAAITATARAIAVSPDLSRRVPHSGPGDEVGNLALTFNEMLASLDAVSAAQRRFVADASHELRAPLTTILGNAEALVRRPDTPPRERAEALDDIADEARRLSRLVGALLSLARADAGMQLTLRQIWLDRLVLESAGRLAAARPGAAVRAERVEPVCVSGDDDRLRELVVILLDNALKYSAPGRPVCCSVYREGNAAHLVVRDEGIGIAPEDLPHIFERFYRADRARRRDEEGSGLGLAIAAWIVEQHRGHIAAQSVEGAGSTVTVTLPIEACPN